MTIAVGKGMVAAKDHKKRGSFAAAFFSAVEPGTCGRQGEPSHEGSRAFSSAHAHSQNSTDMADALSHVDGSVVTPSPMTIRLIGSFR